MLMKKSAAIMLSGKKPIQAAVTLVGFEDVLENYEKSIQNAVADQPVSVPVGAGGRQFHLYKLVNKLAVVSSQYFGTTSLSIVLNLCLIFIRVCSVELCTINLDHGEQFDFLLPCSL